MAKQPSLTVNVNTQQVQQFVQSFNTLSKQMQTLNTHFKQISTAINQSNKSMMALSNTMKSLKDAGMGLYGTVSKITRQFLTWSTIIGGVTTLLGMGGGLFGIERLAASILARRRLTLGLGGDYGRIQAAQIFGQGLMSSPANALQNVAAGLHGEPDKLLPLIASGINPIGARNLDPDEVMDKMMEKAISVMKQAGPGLELRMASAYGFDRIFDIPTLIRLTTDEGREELKYKKELVAKYKEELKISPQATKAWAEFSMQLQVAGAQIQKLLGESLVQLAGPLKRLSEGFTHLIEVLLQSKAMRDILNALSKLLEKWATQLKSITEEKINEFFKDFKTVMKDLRAAFKLFTEALEAAVPFLRFFVTGSPFAMGGAGTKFGNWVRERWKNFHPSSLGDWFKGLLASPAFGATRPGGANGGGNPFDPSSDQYRRQFQDPAPPAQNEPPPAPAAPAPAAPAPVTTAPASSSISSSFYNNSPTSHNAFVPTNLRSTIGVRSQFNSPWTGMFGAGSIAHMKPGTPMDPGIPSAGSVGVPGGPGRPLNKSSWNKAIHGMGPRGGGGEAGAMLASLGGGGRSSRGPLDSDNWQSSRTTSLTIRNVPGANVFMTAAGMQG